MEDKSEQLCEYAASGAGALNSRTNAPSLRTVILAKGVPAIVGDGARKEKDENSNLPPGRASEGDEDDDVHGLLK